MIPAALTPFSQAGVLMGEYAQSPVIIAQFGWKTSAFGWILLGISVIQPKRGSNGYFEVINRYFLHNCFPDQRRSDRVQQQE